MRLLLGYWVIGCLMAGVAIGAHAERCPNDVSTSEYETLAFILTWPAVFTAFWFDFGPLPACEAQP